MRLRTKCFKRYVIQYFDSDIDEWIDVKCEYNGKFNYFVSNHEGRTSKPSPSDMEAAKLAVSNFSDSMFRIAEKTYIIIEEFSKSRVR